MEQKPKSATSKRSKSSKSSGSRLSSASAILIKQQADLEAAKVRHKYVEQESELIVKRAALDANLKLLNSQTWIKLKQEWKQCKSYLMKKMNLKYLQLVKKLLDNALNITDTCKMVLI